MSKYPSELLEIISYLKKLPGVGKKTAERYTFSLFNWSDKELKNLAQSIAFLKEKVTFCPDCFALQNNNKCQFCEDETRDHSLLCIVGSAKDIFAIEDTHVFRGAYHVIGSLLSPLDGVSPDQLNIPHLMERVKKLAVKEMIIGLDATLEGDATALYLKNLFQKEGINVSRLALGLPMGSSLDFVDGGTLSQALAGRRSY